MGRGDGVTEISEFLNDSIDRARPRSEPLSLWIDIELESKGIFLNDAEAMEGLGALVSEIDLPRNFAFGERDLDVLRDAFEVIRRRPKIWSSPRDVSELEELIDYLGVPQHIYVDRETLDALERLSDREEVKRRAAISVQLRAIKERMNKGGDLSSWLQAESEGLRAEMDLVAEDPLLRGWVRGRLDAVERALEMIE